MHMREAIRRYVPTVAAIVVIAVCVTAGNWQRARMHYKQGLRTQFEAAAASAPLNAQDLPQVASDWQALRYRPVALAGTFDASHQFLLDNRVQAGQVGYDVIAPLRLADGRVVLVDRGWVAQGRSRAEPPEAPPPAGAVTVHGRIELPPSTFFELKRDTAPRKVWQHLDLARFAALYGITPMPIVVQEIEAAPAKDGLSRTWPEPDFGIDTHRIYMMQWYAFAAIALAFWVVTHWPRAWRLRPSRAS